jgi:hypothetical protein
MKLQNNRTPCREKVFIKILRNFMPVNFTEENEKTEDNTTAYKEALKFSRL